MSACPSTSVIHDLRRRDFQVRLAAWDRIGVKPIDRLSEDDLFLVQEHKPALLRELKRELSWRDLETRAVVGYQGETHTPASRMRLAYAEMIGEPDAVRQRWVDLVMPLKPSDVLGRDLREGVLQIIQEDWVRWAIHHGWSERHLFAISPSHPRVRIDMQGVIPSMLLSAWAGKLTVYDVSDDVIEMHLKSGATLSYRRRQMRGGVPLWDAVRRSEEINCTMA